MLHYGMCNDRIVNILLRASAFELVLFKSLLDLFIFISYLNLLFYKFLLDILLFLVLFIITYSNILLTQIIIRFQYFLCIILHNIFKHILKINKPSVLFVFVHLLPADKTQTVYIKFLDYCAITVYEIRHQWLELLLFVNEGLWLWVLIWFWIFIILYIHAILGELILILFLVFLFGNFYLLQSLTFSLYYVLLFIFLF